MHSLVFLSHLVPAGVLFLQSNFLSFHVFSSVVSVVLNSSFLRCLLFICWGFQFCFSVLLRTRCLCVSAEGSLLGREVVSWVAFPRFASLYLFSLLPLLLLLELSTFRLFFSSSCCSWLHFTYHVLIVIFYSHLLD